MCRPIDSLSKKYFYDVIKSSQEDTILESDNEYELYSGDMVNPKTDVACNTRTRRKSLAIQTKFYRAGGNFRNEYTSTNPEENNKIVAAQPAKTAHFISTTVEPVTVVTKSIITDVSDVHHFCDVQTTISFDLITSQNSTKCIAVDRLDLQAVKNISVGKETPLIKINKSVGTDNRISDKCVDVCIAYRRSFPPSRSFSLGTAEYRKFQKENCHTTLIGGCRVPVCNTSKTRF